MGEDDGEDKTPSPAEESKSGESKPRLSAPLTKEALLKLCENAKNNLRQPQKQKSTTNDGSDEANGPGAKDAEGCQALKSQNLVNRSLANITTTAEKGSNDNSLTNLNDEAL